MVNDFLDALADLPSWVYVVAGGGGTLFAPYAKEFFTVILKRWGDTAARRESGEQAVSAASVSADASVAVVREQETTKRVEQLFEALDIARKANEELHRQLDAQAEKTALSELDCERRLNAIRLELMEVQHVLGNTRLGIQQFVVEEFERHKAKDDKSKP